MKGYESAVHTSAGAVTATSSRLLGVVVTGNGGNAILVVEDGNGGTERLRVRVLQNHSEEIIFGEDCALLFGSGIYLGTVTNAEVTVLYE